MNVFNCMNVYIHFLQVQSCSAMQWLKCAGVVAKCAAECIQGVMSQTCISCLGDSYNECKGCFSVIKEFQQHGKSQSTYMYTRVFVKWMHVNGRLIIAACSCSIHVYFTN